MSHYNDEVFRLLCNTLGSFGAPGSFVHRTELNASLLPALTALAEAERVLPAFDEAIAVRHGGAVAKEIRTVCAVRQQSNRQRNLTIRKAVLELGREAAAEGFAFAALKGVGWVLEDSEDAAAWRWMIDIDVLTEQNRFDKTPAFLERLGYARASDDRRYEQNFHLAPYARPDTAATIEVHRHLGWRHELLPPQVVFDSSEPITDGLLLPAPWCRAYHGVIHWQLQDFGATRATISLKDMIDIDRFLRRPDVDWARFAAFARSNGTMKACEAAIALTASLFGAPWPAEIPTTQFGKRHVAVALLRRNSQLRTWFAREKWRAGSLWWCEKVAYRLAIRGAGPAKIHAAVWSIRLLRAPVLLVRAVGILWRGARIYATSRRQSNQHANSLSSDHATVRYTLPKLRI